MNREHFVYRTYDADGYLLYVGCTKRLDTRWAEHGLSTSPTRHMVDRTARCRLQGPYAYEVARRLEAQAIEAEQPEFNFTRARRRDRMDRSKRLESAAKQYMALGADWPDAYRWAMEDIA